MYFMEMLPFLSEATANSVINVVKSDVPESCPVWSTERVSLPPNSRCRVKCRTKLSASSPTESVMFSPDPCENELEMTESVSKLHLGRTPSIHVVVTNPTCEESRGVG